MTIKHKILLLFYIALIPVVYANANKLSSDPNTSETETKPMVIWYFHPERDSLNSVQQAFDSGVITHIILYTSNRWTGILLNESENRQKLKWVIQTSKEKGIKTVFVRNLWPTHTKSELGEGILFSKEYYKGEIQRLRTEAANWGTDFVGLDIEAYGGKASPVGRYLRWGPNYIPTNDERKQLESVISEVIQEAGKVDFLYPAGSIRPYHFYNIISRLGINRIAESTYYDNREYQQVKYPYEIFGVYLNTDAENKNDRRKPYYTVESLFNKSSRWSAKKGVFLYPNESRSEEVTLKLKQYTLANPSRKLNTR